MGISNKRLTFVPQNLHVQRGASLLEGIAYLGIAAIVVLGAVSLLSSAFGSAQSNRTAEEVTAIRTALRKLYMGQPYGATATALNASALQAGAFPATLKTTAPDTVINAWGGTVVVTGNGATFDVSYAAVPNDVCIATLSTASGWTSVSVNNAAAIVNFPVSPDAAADACNSTTGGNIIEFTAI